MEKRPHTNAHKHTPTTKTKTTVCVALPFRRRRLSSLCGCCWGATVAPTGAPRAPPFPLHQPSSSNNSKKKKMKTHKSMLVFQESVYRYIHICISLCFAFGCFLFCFFGFSFLRKFVPPFFICLFHCPFFFAVTFFFSGLFLSITLPFLCFGLSFRFFRPVVSLLFLFFFCPCAFFPAHLTVAPKSGGVSTRRALKRRMERKEV